MSLPLHIYLAHAMVLHSGAPTLLLKLPSTLPCSIGSPHSFALFSQTWSWVFFFYFEMESTLRLLFTGGTQAHIEKSRSPHPCRPAKPGAGQANCNCLRSLSHMTRRPGGSTAFSASVSGNETWDHELIASQAIHTLTRLSPSSPKIPLSPSFLIFSLLLPL